MNFFYVTSFITEKISKRVIEVEGIKEFEIISDMRYEPYSNSYVTSSEIYNIKKPLKKNIISNWKSILSGNKKISNISKGSFDIYIPNANLEFVRIIMSHKLCKKFHFIEEGFTSYCEFGDIDIPKRSLGRKMKEYLEYMGYIVEGEIFKKGYSTAYGVSEYCFPNWNRKKIVSPNFPRGEDNSETGVESCILVIDSMETLEKIKKEVYISSLSRVVSKLESKYEVVYYKLHPDNYVYGNEKIFESIVKSCSCETEKIDQTYSIEELSINSGLDVIVNLSSAGLYCILFSNSKVYTFYDTFRSQAKKAGISEDGILGFEEFVPDVFWENAVPFEQMN